MTDSDIIFLPERDSSELGYTGICMTESEREEWDFLNLKAGPLRADNPCADCLPAFHVAMMQAGTCDGRPPHAPRNKHRGTSSGEKLTRSEAQRLLREKQRAGLVPTTQAEKMRAKWRDPAYRERIERSKRNPGGRPRVNVGPCIEPDCDDPQYRKHLCSSHYNKQWKASRKAKK